jgi:pimeloyl-ACP methyl ester carboxylesterase
MESQIANTANGPVEYTLLGSGPVVLTCHGTSSDCFSRAGQAPLLEAGLSVLTPSRPGYGRTPSEVGRSAAEAAAALVALLDALEIETCAVMAISGGGPTGVALTANFPQRVRRLALVAAITKTEGRASEPSYPSQVAFYGPMHVLNWSMLGLVSRLSPTGMARQTMTLFSTHDPQDASQRLTQDDIQEICRFYHGRSSRAGALNDFTHTVGAELLQKVQVPTLVVHSREDKSVPFIHAEWSLANIPQAQLCESGFTGHFFWVGPDYARVSRQLVAFFSAEQAEAAGLAELAGEPPLPALKAV